MIKNKYKKLFFIILTIFLSISLISCKSDFSEYAGLYVMKEDPIVGESDITYEVTPIESYSIELTKDGFAIHTLKVGLLEEEALFSNHYDIRVKRNEIHFYIKEGLIVMNKEEWDFTDNKITMSLEVPIKENIIDNFFHYVTVTVTLEKEPTE